MLPSDPMLTVAIRSVTHAAEVARVVQNERDAVRHITKDDRSPVTVADFAVQAVVALDLRAALGNTPIVGEERADELRRDDHAPVRDAVLDAVRRVHPDVSIDEVLDAIDACGHDGSAGAYWTLDPVDGTKGFLRGQQYAVALAWIDAGRVIHGVMGCPNLPTDHDASLTEADDRGVVYTASAGAGAWAIEPGAAPAPIRSAAHRSGDAIRSCESVESGHSSQSDTGRILETLGAAGTPARLDSQCKYAIVARGQADAYLRLPTRADYVEKIWDHAAGSLIAEEAGAIVSDITGAPLHFDRGSRLEGNRGIICAADGLHARIIEAIGELGIGSRAPTQKG